MSNGVYDVAIVGGGPAGLSAAILLGRSRRRVVVIDHGRPRNYAAKAIHGFLGLDGIAPAEFRKIGREQCGVYGVEFVDEEVIGACQCEVGNGAGFELQMRDGATVRTKKLLLATGVRDELPSIANIAEFYGTSVHHCPYCDGWEHRDQRLVAFGQGESGVELALMLLNWSPRVTLCTGGKSVPSEDVPRLQKHGIRHYESLVKEMIGGRGILEAVRFANGESLSCDACFSARRRASGPNCRCLLGCECGDDGLIVAKGKQRTGVPGLFVAGDADGDVQFAVVAAAEGAIAATAINRELQTENEASDV